MAYYDLAPPVYQSFPHDTTIASIADLPPIDEKVKILDLCQYMVWDTVTTMPVLAPETSDTVAFTRRWMARDPSWHESFQDQMILIPDLKAGMYYLQLKAGKESLGIKRVVVN